MMKQSPARQSGLSVVGFMLIAGLLGFLLVMGFRLLPAYMDNFAVKSVLEDLENEPTVLQKSKTEIRKMIRKRLDINNVAGIESEHIQVEKKGRSLLININYEVRVPLIGNLDAIAHFDENYEASVN